jgi:nucleoside-diphosphate-sugar epimerase
MNKNVFIAGCGDIGRRVARLVQESGVAVTALSRSGESAEKNSALGIRNVMGTLDDIQTLTDLPLQGNVVFYFAPPPGGGIVDTRVHTFLEAIPAGQEPDRIIYLSTSGVYGDCGDATVTEDTPANPQTARSKRRLDAEMSLLAWGNERKVKVVILRVTGIYGPGRLPVTQLASGQPVLEEQLSPQTNRIHADDLANVCLAAAERGADGEIINVSDGQSSTMTAYFNAAADYLGYPRPKQVGWDEARQVMSPLMLSYMAESRRMDNSRMINHLGITLRYPTLQEGLKGCAGERL